MASRAIFISCILLMLLVLTISCSGGDPVTGNSGMPDASAERTMQEYESNHYLWNFNLVYVNPRENEFEIIPVRQVADHWNILGFLEQGPCTDCLKITQIQPSGNGTLLVDIEIAHPFDNANLTGFDVRGIAMFSGSQDFPTSGLNVSDRWLGDGALVNADGYTTLYNFTTAGSGPGGLQGYIEGELVTVTTPDALLNGYRRFISDGSENTRNAFYSGDAIAVTYEIKMPDGPFVFGYAVDASWIPAINQPVEDPMTDFGPEANCPEAWKIAVTSTYAGDGLTASGGTAKLMVDVYDWQGKDDVHPILVECPELFDGTIEGAWESDGDGYTRYEAEIENVKLAPSGFYTCLVSKEAQENDPVGKPWLDLTAYQVFNIEVGWPADFPIDVTPPWLSFSPYDICVEGDYAYIAASRNGMLIFDISDPENPVGISRIDTTWYAARVVVSGSYAVIASNHVGHPDYSKLDIVDIDPPESAHIVNTINFFGYVSGLAVSGSSVCYIRRVQGGPDLYIIDIEPPESAQVVKSFYMPWSSSGDVAASDGYACVPTEFGIWIMDIDPPESSYVVSTVDSDINGEAAVSDGYAYATDWSSDLLIVDIDPPESTYIVDIIDMPVVAEEIVAADGYLYGIDGSHFHIMDVVPPASTYLVNSIDLAGENTNTIAVSGGYAYAGDSITGVQIIDIDPPESAYSINVFDTLSNADGVALAEGYAYVADDYGLQIVDVDPLESAYIVKSVYTPGGANGIAASSGYACLTIPSGEIHLIDIDPPESAYIVNTVDTPGMASEVAMSGDYAYVADNEYGLQIIDISPPESAYIVKTVDTPGNASGVRLSGEYAYVADREFGLQIIDISPPGSAYILHSVYMPGSALRVTVSGEYAYVAYDLSQNSGFNIIDIDPPGQAYIFKSVPTNDINALAISGGYAYIADSTYNESGFKIFDIDPPGSAYYVKSYSTPADVTGIVVSDNYAYVAGNYFGLKIIQLW